MQDYYNHGEYWQGPYCPEVSEFKGYPDYFSRFYPSLYIYILEHLEQRDKLKHYIEGCKDLLWDDLFKFSKYVHGYFLPWLKN